MTNLQDHDESALARERLLSERRQLGGLMFLLGTCAVIEPLARISSLVGTNDSGADTSTEKVLLVGSIMQVIFSCLAMFVGYLSLVHAIGNAKLSRFLILLVQLAWIPFITRMVDIGQLASGPYTIFTKATIVEGAVVLEDYVSNSFIPDEYLPTQRDVRFFGAMGVLGVFSYGIATLGSVAFTAFAVFSFDIGQPYSRDTSYYRSRLLFYTFVLILAGLSQLLLGVYTVLEIGYGPLNPPVGVAMYVIHFPEISIALGGLQMMVGYYGVLRYLGWAGMRRDNYLLQILLAIQWVLMLALQCLVQIGYGEGGDTTGATLSLALSSVGLNVLPAFLDYKMRSLPKHLRNEYYGIVDKASNRKAITAIDDDTPERDEEQGENFLPPQGSQHPKTREIDAVNTSETAETRDLLDNTPNIEAYNADDCPVASQSPDLGTSDANMGKVAEYKDSESSGEQKTEELSPLELSREELAIQNSNAAAMPDNEQSSPMSGDLMEPDAAVDQMREFVDMPNSELTDEPPNLHDSSELPGADEVPRLETDDFHSHKNPVIEEESEQIQVNTDAEQQDNNNLQGETRTIQNPEFSNASVEGEQNAANTETGVNSKLRQEQASEDKVSDVEKTHVQTTETNADNPDNAHAGGSIDAHEEFSINAHEDLSISDKEHDLSDDSSAADDSTAMLEARLEEIEKELFTESMGNYAKSLQEIL